jgi:hypothetical protein
MSYKRRRLLFIILCALAVVLAGLWGVVLPAPKVVLEQITPKAASSLRVAALLATYQGTSTLGMVQKNTGCVVQGALPDASCTPGAVFPDAAPAVICVPGYTTKVRSVSTKLKKQIYTAYGLSYPPPTGTYELDHLVPLALGGSNDAANLFPEAATPVPGFKEKDVVEVYLYQEMCAGHIPLQAAQAQIAANWLGVYQALSADDIATLKAKYKSWAN